MPANFDLLFWGLFLGESRGASLFCDILKSESASWPMLRRCRLGFPIVGEVDNIQMDMFLQNWYEVTVYVISL